MTKGKPWTYQTLWGATLPTTVSAQLNGGGSVGMKFQVSEAGVIMGLRFAWNGTVTQVWSNMLGLLAFTGTTGFARAAAFGNYTSRNGSTPGWNNIYFRKAFRPTVNNPYWVQFIGGGLWKYMYTPATLSGTAFVNGSISVPADGGTTVTRTSATSSGTGPLQLATAAGGNAFGIDILFLPDSARHV